MTRREFLSVAAAPAIIRSPHSPHGYTRAEVEALVERGRVDVVTRHDIPTPALLLDLNAFEANVAKMSAHLKQRGKAFRPHGKTHKCPDIAKALVRAGAVGTCAAKLSEAEVFATHGLKGILVTTQVVDPEYLLGRLVTSRRKGDIPMNILYSTEATATGGREGHVQSSDGRIDVQLALPKELGGPGGPGTNPEQLFAAGFAASDVGFAGVGADVHPATVVVTSKSVDSSLRNSASSSHPLALSARRGSPRPRSGSLTRWK